MPALAQRAGTKNQLIDYDFGQQLWEEPAPGIRIHMLAFSTSMTSLVM